MIRVWSPLGLRLSKLIKNMERTFRDRLLNFVDQ